MVSTIEAQRPEVELNRLRVLLANRPRMLREVVQRQLEQQPGIEVVGEETDPLAVIALVGKRSIDAVILTAPPHGQDPPLCRVLLEEHPRLVVLGISTTGEPILYRLAIQREPLVGADAGDLAAALRAGVRGALEPHTAH